MDCSLPFVMLPNKATVELCSTRNFYVIFVILSIIIAIVLGSYYARLDKRNKELKIQTSTTTAVSFLFAYVIILVGCWYGMRFLIISGDVSSWEGYQAQVAALQKSGMSRSAALQAIQNQLNTRNIEYDIATQGQANNGVYINI